MNLHLLVCTLRFLLPATVVQCTLRKEKTIGPKLWAHEIQLFNMQRSQGRLLKPTTNRVPLPFFFSTSFRGFVRVCKCTSAAATAPLSFPTPECQWWGIERFFLLSRPFQYSPSFPFFDGCSRSPAQSQGFSEADFGGRLPRTANYNTLRIYTLNNPCPT